ncbi:acyltransferase family protein [Hydrocarboniphaga sp.]|uniref:acyltransferase family protein n=1 Tax=Hydrocarboniphaga sp. TaxID=2033016 RepID=UPI003D14D5E7
MAQEIRTLTGLRGLAALGVINHHVNIFVVGGTVWLRGQTFVDLFFVLSGFVMSLTYLGHDATGAASSERASLASIPCIGVSPTMTQALLLVIAVAIYAAPAISGSDAWFLLPVYPPLIYALAANDGRIGWLNNRVAVWLGDISYSLYLIHPVVLLGLKGGFDAMPKMPQALALLVYGVAATALSIVLSAASYRWLEKPARAMLSARKQQAAPRQNARLPVSVSHHMRQSPAKE